jgi:hypothetical protein
MRYGVDSEFLLLETSEFRETFVTTYQTTRYRKQQDNPNLLRHKDLKLHAESTIFS